MTEDERLKRIEAELELIKERNLRVEADKAWEGSATRLGFISALTYLFAMQLLYMVGTERPWLGAVVPVLGFLISSQSLPTLKRRWIESRCKPNT